MGFDQQGYVTTYAWYVFHPRGLVQYSWRFEPFVWGDCQEGQRLRSERQLHTAPKPNTISTLVDQNTCQRKKKKTVFSKLVLQRIDLFSCVTTPTKTPSFPLWFYILSESVQVNKHRTWNSCNSCNSHLIFIRSPFIIYRLEWFYLFLKYSSAFDKLRTAHMYKSIIATSLSTFKAPTWDKTALLA